MSRGFSRLSPLLTLDNRQWSRGFVYFCRIHMKSIEGSRRIAT